MKSIKRSIVIIVVLSISIFTSFAQHNFESGYFILNSNERINCQIYNQNWVYNPTEFQYKLSQSEQILTASIDSIKEFGVDSVSKFVRAFTNIDQSGDRLDNMSEVREPEFVKKQLFLKVLIESKASLFLYRSTDLTRFFYQRDDSAIIQLVYKRYRVKSYISKNNSFRQQLYTELACQEFSLDDVELLEYNQHQLERFFKKYNECQNHPFVYYKKESSKDKYGLTIRTGIMSRDISIQNKDVTPIVYRIGFESELMLPSNNKKWSIFTEPTFQYYKAETTFTGDEIIGGIISGKVKYYNIDLPLGIRHYMHINDKSALFANVLYVYNLNIYLSQEYTKDDGTINKYSDRAMSGSKTVFGAGYKYKNKYSLEIQYPSLYNRWFDFDFKTVSFIFGYKIL